MANNLVAFRLPPEEKHALKILSAEADMTLTDFVLDVLRRNTALPQKALSLANSIPQHDLGLTDGKAEDFLTPLERNK